MDNRIWHLLWYCRRLARIASDLSLRGAASPTILGAGVLGAFFTWRGQTMTFAEGWQGVVAAGIVYTAIAWGVMFAFRLAFVAPFRIWRGGHWIGDQFVYDKPVLAFHRRVSTSDNERSYHFRFKEAPPFSHVEYTTEIAGHSNLIAVMVEPHWRGAEINVKHLRETGARVGGGSFRVNRKRDMYMATNMLPQADPISVRVWVTSWRK